MRILHIYKDYYPVLGGIENHLRALAEGQAARGHDVTVLVANPARRTTIELLNGVRVIKAARWATVASTPISPALFRELARLKMDVAHLHFPYPFGDVAHTLFSRASHTVITYHSDIVRQKTLLRLYAPWLRRTLRRAQRIIATSPRYAASSPFLASHGDKVAVVPYGIDLARFATADPAQVAQIQARYGSPLLLFVGQLRYYKGVEYLVRAMPQIAGRALLIGSDTTTRRAELERLAQELNVADRVIFLGEQDADLPVYYQASDVFVLPSIERSEAFGIVQIEAMAAGLPLISTELGTGTSWVNVHEQTGLVVPPNDPRALAEGINRLLADAAWRKTLGAAARARAQAEFSVERMIDRVLDVYQLSSQLNVAKFGLLITYGMIADVWQSTLFCKRQAMTNSTRLSAFCERLIEAGWLAALVLAPLFFNVYSSRVFEPDKLTLVRSIALVMVGAWLIKWLEERKSDRTRADRVTWRTPLVLPTLILVGLYLVTSVLSLVPRVSFMGSYQRLQGTYSTFSYIVIFFMLLLNMRRREQLDRLVTTAVITSLPIAFYGLLQHGDGTTSIDPLPWGGDVTSRVASNMGNAIFVAAYLIMAFFLTLGRIIDSFRVILTEKESRLSDILRASSYVFIGAVQLIAFGFADSRGPLLGWLPGMFIFGLVGLLLLRVTLQTTTNEVSHDTLKEIFVPLVLMAVRLSIAAAIGVGAYLVLGSAGQIVRAGLSIFAGTATGLTLFCVMYREAVPTVNLKIADIVRALEIAIYGIGGALTGAVLAFALFPITKISLVVVIALLGGLLPVLIVAGVRRIAARWLWTSWIIFSIVGAMGLFLVNFSDMPLIVELRSTGAFGRLSSLFETEGGTGEVRSLIWEGASKLVLPHDPLKFPDGSTDSLNFLRPAIGYGPESMYVAYNPFYPPDLAHLEARNASPDRSHNEVWDSLVITGGVGFIVEQFLFLSVFFFALKFIGWIPNRRAAIFLFGLMIAGGVAGAVLLAVALQPNFFGPGWTGGVTGGLVLYVVAFALFHFQISRRVYVIIAAALISIVVTAIYLSTFTSDNRAIELTVAVVGGIILFGLLFVAGRAVFGPTAGQPIEMSGHLFLIIALFGGILAHYLEIGLAGIAIASTRTYFWTYAGLLVLTGLKWVPVDDEAPKPAALPASPTPGTPVSKEPSATTPRHKKKTVHPVTPVTPTRREPRRTTPWLGSVLVLALIGALVLSTLGYEFITSSNQTQGAAVTDGTQLIVNSLTRLPYQNNRESMGALLMFFVTWLFGGLLSITELRRRDLLAAKDVLPAAAVWYGASIGLALTFWLIHAGTLLSLGKIIQGTQITTLDQYAQRVKELLTLAETVGGLLATFYVVVLLIMLGIAALSMVQARTWHGKTASDWGLAVSVPVVIVVVVLVITTNLNSIRADTIYKQADPLRAQGQWDVAIAHYKRVLELAPDEDFYYLWLGAAYLEKASQAPEAQSILATTGNNLSGILKLTFQQTYGLSKQDSLLAAKTVLENARLLNPLNTDHSANLARLYRRWADLYAADPAVRKTQLDQSGAQYQIATTLSPNNAILWNEWSTVLMALSDSARAAGDTAGADAFIKDAQAKLDHSLALDQQFEQTYLIRAQLARSQGQTDAARLEYEKAMEWNPNSTDAWGGLADMLVSQGNYTEVETITLAYLTDHPDFLPGLRTLARNVYFPQNRLGEALATQQRVVQLAASDPNLWDDQRVLAILLAQSGQIDLALQTAQQALAGAPEANKAEINSLITQLQGSLGITSPVTPTTP